MIQEMLSVHSSGLVRLKNSQELTQNKEMVATHTCNMGGKCSKGKTIILYPNWFVVSPSRYDVFFHADKWYQTHLKELNRYGYFIIFV